MMIKSAEFIKGIVGTDDVLDDVYPEIAFDAYALQTLPTSSEGTTSD